MTRDTVKPEDLEKVCREAGETGNCSVTAGMGLGWEVETVNGVKILDHDGSDRGVKTLVMFVPSQGVGVVVLPTERMATRSPEKSWMRFTLTGYISPRCEQ
jgi:Beta-lactamase